MAENKEEDSESQGQLKGRPVSTTGEQVPKATIEIPADRAYFLHRTEVLLEVQQELVSWAQRRFWTVTVIVLLAGYFGGTAIIKETTRALVEKEVAEANKAAIIASQTALRAGLATDEVAKQAAMYTRTVTDLQEKAKQVDTQFIAMQQRLERESGNVKANAERELKAASERIARIEQLVAQIAQDSKASQQAVAAYKKEMAEFQSLSAEQTSKFTENSRYEITVYYNEKTASVQTDVIQKLAQAGFKAASVDIRTLHGTTFPILIPEGGARIFPSPPSISTNILVYDSAAEKKANEVAELLRSQVKFKEIRPYRQLSDPLPLSLSVSWVVAGMPTSQRMAVYLAEKS